MTRDLADAMESLLGGLAALGTLSLGRGPDHPTRPNPALGAGIDTFLARYPFVGADAAYGWFQRRYAGALLEGPVEIGIYGFDDAVTMHIVHGPGDVIEEGVLTFCDMTLRDAGTTIHGAFGFEATGERPPGVYRVDDGVSTRYADSFEYWLRAVVDRRGRVLGGCS